MKKIFYFFSAITMIFANAALGQFTNVLISSSNSPEEVSIAINPKNTNQIVAGANINNVFYSNDDGHNWTSQTLTDAVSGVWGDPCIFSDTAGNFYFVHLSNPPTNGNWVDRIVCAKSTNSGVSWSQGTYTGLNGIKVQDKAWTVVNQKTNEIYVSWTQFDVYGPYPNGQTLTSTDSSRILFSKSSDGGQTWSAPQRISKHAGNCWDSDSTVEGAVPAIGPNGEIYVAWSGPEGIVFNKSLDDGNTWLPQETVVTTVPGGWAYNISGLQRCNGLPITLCDLSNGPNRGNIYINWSDQRNGTTDTDVWLIKSTDGGNTWGSPVRVNNDPPGKQQFMCYMCIDQSNGYLYLDYYDRRNFSASDSTDIYLARSTDGGSTFTNYKVNQTSFVPDPGVFFGDYIGIAANNNMVRPIWMTYNGSTLSAWTAIVDTIPLTINELNASTADPIELMQNYPNPFQQTTWIKFKLKKSGKVNLFVYDMLGNKVAVLYENERFNEGNYDYIFNASLYNLKPGVYYYSLSCDEYQRTEKMIVY